MRLLAIATLSLSVLTSIAASATDEAEGTSSGNAGVIQSYELEGVHLGMTMDEAIAALTESGFAMEGPRPPDALTGVRVQGKKTTDDQKGSVSIMLSVIDGTVYHIQEQVAYYPGRLPDGMTMETLGDLYKDKFVKPFETAKYQADMPNGWIAFDDETPAPYSKPSTTPHVDVIISSGGRQGFAANLNIMWKGLVGATW